jgi:hypothetical protein
MRTQVNRFKHLPHWSCEIENKGKFRGSSYWHNTAAQQVWHPLCAQATHNSGNSFCFFLGTAVYQPIIRIPTPWEIRMCPRHPEIERVMHKEIGQNWTHHSPYTKGNLGL